jgi:integrase
VVLLGFAGAFRRSELVALTVEDLEFSDGGVLATVRRSKTDQEGSGREVGIPFGQNSTCPVAALRAWLATANIKSGPIFRRVDQHGLESDPREARIGGRGGDDHASRIKAAGRATRVTQKHQGDLDTQRRRALPKEGLLLRRPCGG